MKKVVAVLAGLMLSAVPISATIATPSNEGLHVNFKEHDLVKEANIGGSSDVTIEVNDGELKLTSPDNTKKTYYSKEYDLDATKTYFISGEYKTSTDTSGWRIFNNKWTPIKELTPSTSYSSFFATFTPSAKEQLIIQRSYPDDSSSLSLTLKDLYFGECREATKGSAIGTLPTLESGKWQIDGEDITATTVFTWDEDKYADIAKPLHLNFKEHNLISEVNYGGTPTLVPSVVDNELVFTASNAGTGDTYWSNYYNFDLGKTYFLSGEYKTTTGAGVNIVLNDGWSQIYMCEASTSYTQFFTTFTPSEGKLNNQFCMQCSYGAKDSVFTFKSLYFGEYREVTKGSAIGELPVLESGKWQIDGTDITSETIFTWDEDKYADIVQPLHVNFKEHDLVKEANIGVSSTMDVKVEDNELVLTSSTDSGQVYYSKIYTFDTNKTYFVCGEYKTTAGAGANFVTLPDWTVVKACEASTSYTPFFVTFTPKVNTNQFGIQCSYGGTGAVFNFRNFYFGECREVTKGSAIGELPTLESGKWQIDGEDITATTVFTWDVDKYAEPIQIITDFKLAFTDKNYAQSTEGYETNKKKISYSTDGTTLTLNGEESGAAVFLPELTANIGHNYVISFDLQTEGNSQIVIGVDKKVAPEIITTNYLQSPSDYTHYAFEFKAEFTSKEVNVITAYIQFPDTYFGKAYLQNILIADLDDSRTINVKYNDPVGDLPAIPEGYEGKWLFRGEELTNETIYNVKHSDAACLDATVKELNVSFKVNAEDTKIIATYKVKYGQKLSEVITTLPEVPAVEGKTGKWVLDGKDLDLNTVVTTDLTILASYTDVPKRGGCGGSIVAGTMIGGMAAIGGAILLVLKKKRVIK